MIINCMMLAYLIKYMPADNLLANLRDIFTEILLIVAEIFIALLKEDDQENEEDRVILGWPVVACFLTIVFMHTFMLVFCDILIPLIMKIVKAIIKAWK